MHGVIVFGARNESHFGRHIIDVDQQEISRGIEGVAAPVHSADVSGNDQRAPQAGRGEDSFVSQRLESFQAGFALRGADAPRGIGRNVLRHKRRGRRRKRLRGRSHFPRHIALRHGAFLDRKYWLACVAIEDVEKAGLVALNDDGNIPAVPIQRGQQRRGSAVVIPKIVMDELKSPGDFAGLAARSATIEFAHLLSPGRRPP